MMNDKKAAKVCVFCVKYIALQYSFVGNSISNILSDEKK